MAEWISVKDRLPNFNDKQHKWGRCGYYTDSERVLVCIKQKSGKRMVKEGFVRKWDDGTHSWKIPGSIDEITHWMHLPEPPKGDKCNG